MYRSDLNKRDKGGAIALVVGIHAALLLAFLNLSGKMSFADPQSALKMFDVTASVPPPPPPPAQAQKPKPKIESPPVNPIPAAETPRQGTAPTQGASDVRGPGTGAGGAGTGTGGGSGGTGPGGGGDSGVADPPHLVTPVLTGRDFPRSLLDQWPRGVPVFLRLRVNPQGYVSECNVLRGTGVAAIDNIMCNLAHDRLRFRPAVNRSGQAVAGWFGYAQRPPR